MKKLRFLFIFGLMVLLTACGKSIEEATLPVEDSLNSAEVQTGGVNEEPVREEIISEEIDGEIDIPSPPPPPDFPSIQK